MRFAAWRRGRYFRIVLVIFIVVPLFYILLTWTAQNDKSSLWPSALKSSNSNKARPQLVEGMCS